MQNRQDSPQARRFIQTRVSAPLVVKIVFAMAVMETGGTEPPPAQIDNRNF